MELVLSGVIESLVTGDNQAEADLNVTVKIQAVVEDLSRFLTSVSLDVFLFLHFLFTISFYLSLSFSFFLLSSVPPYS